MDAEFILVSNDTKNSMKKPELAEKWQFLQRVLKMADFRQSTKGGLFAKFLKWTDFLAEIWKVQKIENTCPILT